MNSYPIIANCCFESREDPVGRAVHEARLTVESGLTDDADLVQALEQLEDVLAENADSPYVPAIEACRMAEDTVAEVWRRVRPAVVAIRAKLSGEEWLLED